jgi:NAD(P)H-dependent flavin oxidoreductase YrpB (nitropropane dioxygenase family)
LQDALDAGAEGIQVGTAFAFCAESGITDELKRRALQMSRSGQARVFTSPLASPTGFPFKVLQLEGTLSDPDQYEQRERLCDLGYLRQLYRKEDGTVGYRCSAEPEDIFLGKGGKATDTPGRVCLCNCLLATIGLGQTRPDGYVELPVVTAGDDAAYLVKEGQDSYTAKDVVDYLLSSPTTATAVEKASTNGRG